MQIAALGHNEMAGELATLLAAVSSAAGFMLGHSTNKIFRVGVVDELIAKFQKQEERRTCLERSSARVYDLFLGPPSGRAQPADRLEEAMR
jgi:hypothetical protein